MATSTLTRKQREIRKELLALKPGASPSDYREHIIQLCIENDYDPIRELLVITRGGVARKMFDDMCEISSRIKIEDDKDRLIEIAKAILACGADSKDTIGIHKEILQYVTPKLRSLDVSGEVKKDISIKITRYDEAGNNIGEVINRGEHVADTVKLPPPVEESEESSVKAEVVEATVIDELREETEDNSWICEVEKIEMEEEDDDT